MRSARGFTLIEIILGISLAIALMAAVYSFYDGALGLRRDTLQQAEQVRGQRQVMEHITEELRTAMVYPILQIGMEGSAGSMRFMSAVLPGPAAWVVKGITEDPIPPEHDMQWVGYQLRTYEDEEGMLQVAGLERTCQRILPTDGVEESEVISADLLAPHIKFLRLQYYGNGWVGAWDGSDLPLAVEIILGKTPQPEGMEIEEYLERYPTSRRVVYLPGASQALGSGTVIRGMP